MPYPPSPRNNGGNNNNNDTRTEEYITRREYDLRHREVEITQTRLDGEIKLHKALLDGQSAELATMRVTFDRFNDKADILNQNAIEMKGSIKGLDDRFTGMEHRLRDASSTDKWVIGVIMAAAFAVIQIVISGLHL